MITYFHSSVNLYFEFLKHIIIKKGRVKMIKTKENYACGLNEEEVAASRKRYGSNKLTERKRKSFFKQFAENLGDPVTKVLLAVLIINVIFTFRNIDWLETGGIAVAVILATTISTFSEYSSQSAFKRLSESEAPTANVRRGGRVINIPTSELVVGDVVLLCAGDKVASDGILISGSVFVDQSAMTGESAEKQKRAIALTSPPTKLSEGELTFTDPLDEEISPASQHRVFRGCLVSSGEGEMLVTAVGDKSFLGEIFSEVQLSTRESPLKIRLSKLAKQISRLGYLAGILVALATLFSSIIIQSDFSREVILSKLGDSTFIIPEIIHALTLALTVIIMAVPEGLPMMIAVVLSSNIKRMAKDRVLVRKPVGIEAAGSMNILFCDKTGTLTRGKLSAEGVFGGFCADVITVSRLRQISERVFEEYCENAFYNTSAHLSGKNAVGGNATERALLDSAAKYARLDQSKATKKLPFDSANKYSLATVGKKTYIKGAPEVLLPHVRTMLDEGGREIAFSRYQFEQRLSEETKKGKRVLLLATSSHIGIGLGDMCLVCAVILRDGLRREAAPSVKELRRAGISVVMITGDNPDTAESIARECGILDKRVDLCIISSELSHMTDDEIKEKLDRIGVVARALPSDKSRLVRIAQERGMVVGMTGDGINDAPALRRADIGFAMGNGTQVAKEAGDIIILDNDLASIVKAVLYGRNIFKSIRKFLVFQLTMNFASVGVSMIAPFFGFDTPITVVQMLWVNMIMDTLGGLAFAGEAPSRRSMSEPPKKREAPILNKYMAHQIFFSGSCTVAISMLFLKHPFFVSHFRENPQNRILLSAFFALFIFLGVMQCFNSRVDRLDIFSGISKNRAFIFIMCAISVIQISFVYLGGDLLRTAPLTRGELFFTLSCAALVIPIELLRKIVWRLSGHTTGF